MLAPHNSHAGAEGLHMRSLSLKAIDPTATPCSPLEVKCRFDRAARAAKHKKHGCIRLLAAVMLLYGWSMAAHAAFNTAAPAASRLRDADFMASVNSAFTKIYNLDFDAASDDLAHLERQYPEHPGPPLYRALVLWLEQLDEAHELTPDCFLHPACFAASVHTPGEQAARQRIQALLDASRARCDRRSANEQNGADTLYYRGAVEALTAAIAVTLDRNNFDGIRHAGQAKGTCGQLMRGDPPYDDAALISGLYDYLFSQAPWYVRWLTGGDKKQGMEAVNHAAEKGTWTRDDAILVRMLMRMHEGLLAEAMKDAALLSEKYPRSYLFPLAQGQILDKMGKHEDADAVYSRILELADESKPNYQRIGLSRFRWEMGNRRLSTDPQAAMRLYQAILEDPGSEERWRVLAQLQSGCALDLLGRHEEAVKRYQAVLAMRDYDNSHALASRDLTQGSTPGGRRISIPRLSTP